MDVTATLRGDESVINRNKLSACLQAEREKFIQLHPRSGEFFEKAKSSLLGGVPMNWMIKWAGDYPVFVEEGSGAHFTDVDGHRYLDLCLGDTGAMTGHGPAGSIDAIIDRVRRGTTFMLPTEEVLWVGEELKRRFGLPYWQFALTATDANRFCIRLARHITKRPYVLVFNWCYHGTVDESFITLTKEGLSVPRQGNIGPAVDPSRTTKVIEFNDVAALEAALKDEDVACVLAEPAMTNIGIIHPKPGYHDALRELTRKTGTLLIIDETHTVCAGPGGFTALHGLEPDILTIGKPIASGIPSAVYGFSESVANRIQDSIAIEDCDTGGIGGTLAGNALSIAAMGATLRNVLTQEAYDRTIPLATRFVEGVTQVIREKNLPWNVTQLGCRAEYWFRQEPAVNGTEAADAVDGELDRYMHLASLNRNILMTPFHNMALISPQTTEEDIDYHTHVFREIVEPLLD